MLQECNHHLLLGMHLILAQEVLAHMRTYCQLLCLGVVLGLCQEP